MPRARLCRYIPDRAYLRALLGHLRTQLPAAEPDALAMAVWGLAALQQPPPDDAWAAAWCDAALQQARGWGPQALAHGLSGAAALRISPPAELMQVGVTAHTLRTPTALLPSRLGRVRRAFCAACRSPTASATPRAAPRHHPTRRP
jgi:hypothetical protein